MDCVLSDILYRIKKSNFCVEKLKVELLCDFLDYVPEDVVPSNVEHIKQLMRYTIQSLSSSPKYAEAMVRITVKILKRFGSRQNDGCDHLQSFIQELIPELVKEKKTDLDCSPLLPLLIDHFIHCVESGNTNDFSVHNTFMKNYVRWCYVGYIDGECCEVRSAFEQLLAFMSSTVNAAIEIHRLAMSWLMWYDERLIYDSRRLYQEYADVHTFRYSRALLKRYTERQEMNIFVELYPMFRRAHHMMGMDGIMEPITTATMAGLDANTLVPVIMDRLKMASILLPERGNTIEGVDTPIYGLLQMLGDLVDADEPSRVDLLTPIEQNPQTFSQENNMEITDQFHGVLREIFTLYASKEDGSMSLMNFRRYVLSVGAGEHSASVDRVSRVFIQFEPDFHESRRLRFEGFCAFYKEACTDRLNYVWSDLFTQQYLPNLGRDETERGSVRDSIAKHPEYEGIMSNLLALEQKRRPTFFSFLVKLPVPD